MNASNRKKRTGLVSAPVLPTQLFFVLLFFSNFVKIGFRQVGQIIGNQSVQLIEVYLYYLHNAYKYYTYTL